MNDNITISIDLAKEVFQVAVFNRAGKMNSNKKMSAKKMRASIDKYPASTLVMEACGSAHYWGRYFTNKGYTVHLVPPHLAAKYRTGNKNDSNDAIAIYEASKNPKIHFVAIRTLEQQDMATLHKFREGYKKERNQVANRIRGFAREYGVNFSLGIKPLKSQIPEALEDAENELTPVARQVLLRLRTQLSLMIKQVDKLTDEITEKAKKIDCCKKLVTLPGVAWLGASMIHAKFGRGDGFRRGRDASASIGIVPAHSGSGGKVTIGRITKRGDTYLRSLIINGARSVVMHIKDKEDELSCWIRKLLETKSFNTVVVALANKLIRMAVAMLKSGQTYRQPVAQ
jgi:transposase